MFGRLNTIVYVLASAAAASFLVGLPLGGHAANECGQPNENKERIVNGYDVGFYKYPWYAALGLRLMEGRLMCGGTLVGPRHVITAAHCFKPFFSSVDNGKLTFEDLYTIKLGVYDFCNKEPTQKTFNTKKVYVHEKYREEMPYFDITLIELEEEATGFMPICLPAARQEENNRSSDGYIIGLGKQSSNAFKLPCMLQEAKILVYNDTVCRNMLNSMHEDGSKLLNAFCAGYLSGGIDSCQGDSGGPFQTISKDGVFTIDGITSFGFGCAMKDVLGVYTDVSHYLDWIAQKMALSNSDGNTTVTDPPTTTTTKRSPQYSIDNNFQVLPIRPDTPSSAYTVEPAIAAVTAATTTTTTTPPTTTATTAPPPARRPVGRRRQSGIMGLFRNPLETIAQFLNM